MEGKKSRDSYNRLNRYTSTNFLAQPRNWIDAVGNLLLHAALELVDLVEAGEPLAHRARPAREQAGDVLGRVVLLSHVQNLLTQLISDNFAQILR